MTAWSNNRKRWAQHVAMAAAVALVVTTCCIFVGFSLPVRAAGGAGRIYGQLLDGSAKNAPVVGQRVTLQMAQGNTAMDLSSAATDGHGSFSFAGLATDKTISYAVYMRYQGANYTSAVISLDTKPVQQLNLKVYEATKSMANIAIVRATILLRAPDRQTGIVPVSELFIFRNLDAYTYVGSLDASQGKPNALRFSLPHTASKVTLGKGFDGYTAIQVDSGFATDAAVTPGDSQFAFTFDMPYTSSDYDFDYTVVYPTVLLAFLAPPEIQAGSDTLASQGPITSGQQTYQLLEAKALLAGKEVHVQLGGLPAAPIVTSTPGATTPAGSVPWLVIALLIMAFIISVTAVVYRSVSRQAAAMSKKNGSNGKQRPKQQAQRQQNAAPIKVSDQTGDSEKALLQKLLELDRAYEAGEINKGAYQERRAAIKAQLRPLMSEKVKS